MVNLIIDIDGVICQYDFPRLIEQHFGVPIPNKAIYTYSLEDSLGVSSSAVSKMFEREVYAPPNFIPGAVNILKYFLSKDYDVHILSNRLHWMSPTELADWLDEYGIPYSYVTSNGDLPSHARAHVDDSPVKLMVVREITQVTHSILFDNPWNQRCLNITNALERVKNWKQVRIKVDG